jgi:mannan endo-1,4-beta-mannosidase
MAFVANRVNTVTGVAYRDDPTIAIVSIAGEPGPPNSEECGMAAGTAELTDFFARTMAEWQELDTNHLVSNGGFIHLDWEELHGNPAGSGIDWQAIFSDPANDVPSIHTYVNYPVPMDDPPVPFTEYQTAKIAPFVADLGKPWITEEFGFPQRDPDPGRAVYYEAVYQLQRDYGSAGVAFWSLGHELHPTTFDVNPDTPEVWQVILNNAP